VWEVCPSSWHANPHKKCVLFSHAAGIASGTYLNFLKLWAEKSGQRIFALDCRGIGLSAQLPTFGCDGLSSKTPLSALQKLKNEIFGDVLSPVLKEDLYRTFLNVKDFVQFHLTARQPVAWTLAGHSLGGWLSLMVAHRCFVTNLVLFDISILPKHVSLLWTAACIARQRNIHTLARVAKTRKVCYRNDAEAKRVFKRSPMFRGWNNQDLELYLQSNFTTTENGFELRHDPLWEAALLESQQPSAALGFANIPAHLRDELTVLFVVGAKSEACTLKGADVVKSHFKKSRWVVLPDAKHMFPFTHIQTLLRLLKEDQKSVSPEKSVLENKDQSKPTLKTQALSKKSVNLARLKSKAA
jgi:pimeloyl-ACP methyl ester carboxylesterase